MTRPNENDIDMSPSAVAARLESVRSLYRMMRYLAQFQLVNAPQK